MSLRGLVSYATMCFGLHTLPAAHAAPCARDAFLEITKPSAMHRGERERATFNEAQILALPKASITTATEWSPLGRFEGPLLKDVLKSAGAEGKTLRMSALNGYVVSVPVTDLEDYPVILAHSLDGKKLARHRWGPLFVIYPRDEHPDELKTPTAQAKFIWQLCRIDVEGD